MALSLLIGGTALADEKSDIEQLERALRAEKEALAIYERMRERAWNAVKKSSLFVEWERLGEQRKRAWDEHVDYRPDRKAKREYERNLSSLRHESSKIERRRDEIERKLYPYGRKNNLSDKDRDALKDEEDRLEQQSYANLKKRLELHHEWQKPRQRLEAKHRASRAAEDAAYRRMELLAAKMTLKFLSDAIKKAQAQKRRYLRLKLEQIRARQVRA